MVPIEAVDDHIVKEISALSGCIEDLQHEDQGLPDLDTLANHCTVPSNELGIESPLTGGEQNIDRQDASVVRLGQLLVEIVGRDRMPPEGHHRGETGSSTLLDTRVARGDPIEVLRLGTRLACSRFECNAPGQRQES